MYAEPDNVRGEGVHPVHRLKIDLMTHGVEVSEAARAAYAKLFSNRPLTLAEYASTSGICLELEGGVWVNAPLEEHNPNFVFAPQCLLDHSAANGFVIRKGALEVQARPIPVPDFHRDSASSGEPFARLGVTHTDRVRISPIEGCAYRCTFCDLPTAFPKYRRKLVRDLVETVERAMRDATLPARHVLISGGTPKPEDYDYLSEVFSEVAQASGGAEVDVMMAPAPGLLDIGWLHGIGIHALSINLEVFGEEASRRLTPNKHVLGRTVFRQFLEKAVPAFGPGRVRSLLMVGLEPLEDTLAGVRFLAELGCEPVLSPFRPAPGTRQEDTPPPSVEFLIEVHERSRDIVAQLGGSLGPTCAACQHNTLTFPETTGQPNG